MSAAIEYSQELYDRPGDGRDLVQGLWPRSAIMWLIFGWFALYILRPWEIMFPSLAPLRIERLYCLTVLGFLVLSARLRLDFSWQSLALGGVLAAMYLSALMGIDYHNSTERIYQTIVHVAMYIVVISVVRRPRDLLCIATMYVVIMAMYLGKAQWEYFVHDRHHFTQGVPRLLGIDRTYRHYNSVAASALLTMPMLQLLWSMRTDIGRSFTAAGRKRLKLALWGYGFLAVTSVLLTNSRGGMLGLAIFFFLACVTGKTVTRAIKTLLVAGLIVTPLAFLAVPQTQKARLSTLWNHDANSSAQGSLELRKQAVIDGLKIFVEHPLTGVGLANFKRYRIYRGDASDIEAHNIYVEVLGEMGIIGGAAFVWFVACTAFNFRKIHRLAAQAGSAEARFLEKIALAGRNSLLLLIYFGLLGSNLDRFNWYWLAGVGVAGVVIARRFVQQAEDEAAEFEDGYEDVQSDQPADPVPA